MTRKTFEKVQISFPSRLLFFFNLCLSLSFCLAGNVLSSSSHLYLPTCVTDDADALENKNRTLSRSPAGETMMESK